MRFMIQNSHGWSSVTYDRDNHHRGWAARILVVRWECGAKAPSRGLERVPNGDRLLFDDNS